MFEDDEKAIIELIARDDCSDISRLCERIQCSGLPDACGAVSGLIDRLMAVKWLLNHSSAVTDAEMVGGDAELITSANDPVYADDPVDSLGLSNRATNALWRLKIETVGGLVSRLSTLRGERGFGEKVRNEINDALLVSSGRLTGVTLELQLAALKMLSGANDFVFDEYGRLCDSLSAHRELCKGLGASRSNSAHSIEQLMLPEPTERRLLMHGIATAEELAALSQDDLLRIPHIGSTAIERIGAALAWAEAKGILSQSETVSSMGEFINRFSPQARDAVLRAYALCDGSDEEIDSDRFTVFMLPWIEAKLNQAQASYSDIVKDAADHYRANLPERDAGRKYLSASESEPITLSRWLDMLEGRDHLLLQMSFEGKTLEECGRACEGITRERARQIIQKLVNRRPPIREEEHLHFMETYQMSAEQFACYTGTSAQVFYFLRTIASTRKRDRLPLDRALEDEALSPEVKHAIMEHGDGEAIYIDGERVKIGKRPLSDYLVRTYANDGYISIESLFELYKELLAQRDIVMEGSLDPGDLRAFQVFLERSDSVLVVPRPKGDGRGTIRYYPARSKDFSPLVSLLHSGAFGRIECSTALMFRDEEARSILSELDLRDEYEVHVAIRRFCPESTAFELGRAPIINFGKAVRNEQVFDLICEMSPTTEKAVAAAYEERYGVSKETVLGSFFHDFAVYRQDGMLVYVPETLTDAQAMFLRLELQGDYCALDEIKDAFRAKFPGAATSLLGRDNLDALGYRISGGLILRKGVEEKDLFAELLTSRNRFSLQDKAFGKAVFDRPLFKSELAKRIRNLEIIEYDQDSYIMTSVFGLLAQPVSVEDLRDFVEKAVEMMEPGVPYTVKKLRNLGLSHKVDQLAQEFGFGDFFFASLIGTAYVGGRVKRTSWDGTAIFCRTIGSFSLADMFAYLVISRGGMSIAALCECLRDEYGVEIGHSTARVYAKLSSIAFDADSDTVSC